MRRRSILAGAIALCRLGSLALQAQQSDSSVGTVVSGSGSANLPASVEPPKPPAISKLPPPAAPPMAPRSEQGNKPK